MHCDVAIVGAGTAGSVLAARLSEDPAVSVCLLEAGEAARDPAIADPTQWPALQGTAIDWQYVTVPQAHTAGRTHAWPRGRVVGGSSCLNAMAHVRGHRSDFDAWRAQGCDGWGFADLMPYFVRSETSAFDSPWHGRDGPVRLLTPSDPHPITRCFLRAGAELGFEPTPEHNGGRMAGPTLNTLTLVEGRRQSVADAYLAPALARGNLHLRTGCRVERLAFGAGGRCTGVEVNRRGERETIAAGRVVVCAGTVESPALLLRSGIGAAGDLRALGLAVRVDLPGVGANLHDHLLGAGNVYEATRPVPPSRYQHSESLLYVPGADAAPAPEIVVACVVVPVVTECFSAPPPGSAFTLMFGFTHPHSRGRLRLQSADPGAAPLIDPNYLADERDREAFARALQLARLLGATRALREWSAGEVLPGRELSSAAQQRDFLARAAFTHHHPVGTCAMGTNGASVVDPSLAVHGTQGLYVVDASVIPRLTTGPVNAAVVAIAERASDLLAGRAPLSPFDPGQAK